MRFVTARALLVNPKGEVLVVRRSAGDAYHAGKWDIPGGRVEPGEGLRTAAIRETLEETGVRLHSPELVFAISAPRPEGAGTWLFFVEHIAADATITLSEEHDASKWILFAKLPEYTNYEILLRMHTFVTEQRLLINL